MLSSSRMLPERARPKAEGELEYHERIYSGFVQQHFAKNAVRAFRAHLVNRIIRRTGVDRSSRVLSLGCGIGDTEILMAGCVGHMVGLDFSPAGIRQARGDAAAAGLGNVEFIQGVLEDDAVGTGYDAVFAVFFLHHLPAEGLADAPRRIMQLLKPGGRFYSLDTNRYRLSGAVGSLLIPGLMKKYQSPGETELVPRAALRLFEGAGFACGLDYYDFVSTPLAGLLPSWTAGYKVARLLDDILVRVPALRRLSSNFEILARKPDGPPTGSPAGAASP
jgi:SAM-dependent methyltransferase